MNVKLLAVGLVAFVALVGACALPPPQTSLDARRLTNFENRSEELRTELRIPGMSAVILKNQEVVWAKGFGYADYENRVPATPDTVYHVASITKPIAATLIMQLVEQGKLDLDEPMSHYSSDFKDDSVRIKHLLSHTSGGTVPGERYEYSGSRYDYLTAVIEKKTSKSFREVMVQTILDPLAMSSSVPGPKALDEADQWVAVLGREHLDRYAKNLARLSQPYTLYGDSEIVHVPYPTRVFGAAAGLLSTVMDLARFDAAIDRHVLLSKETQEKAWTPFVSNSGQRLPYALGWFSVDYQGIRLIWHGGNWGTGFSAIYVKVPEKNLSLIMLSNSEALNGHLYALYEGSEDITHDAFACAFLRQFVFEETRDLDCERNSQMAVEKWRSERRELASPVVQVDPHSLEDYVGQYQFEFDPTMILQVTTEGGKLFVDVPADRETEVFPSSPSTFFFKIRPAQMRFIKDGGKVTGLDWVEHGDTLRANKIK
jgi:CubicO group peptidase (beta-lactamase class C family)